MPRPLSRNLYDLLCCPIDHGTLILGVSGFVCELCKSTFPLRAGIPVFLDSSTSLFTETISVDWAKSSTRVGLVGRARNLVQRCRPSNSVNLAAQRNYERIADLALQRSSDPVVLIVGGAEIGRGLKTFLQHPRFTFVESDVYFGNRVNLLADGQQLPIKDSTVDVVICQAVLQHVVDPARCVNEIWRVLKLDGLVYSEIPFMQQVHGGAYDFTRFSLGGCRRLFNKFQEESSGMVAGPGTVLAWSVEYFFRSFSTSVHWHRATRWLTPLFTFWIKYFDYIFQYVQSAQDGASCSFFLGRKSDQEVFDREIVGRHWSNNRAGPTNPRAIN